MIGGNLGGVSLPCSSKSEVDSFVGSDIYNILRNLLIFLYIFIVYYTNPRALDMSISFSSLLETELAEVDWELSRLSPGD